MAKNSVVAINFKVKLCVCFIAVKLFPASDDICKHFGPRNVGPDLDPKCLTLMIFLKKNKKKNETSADGKNMQN